MEIYYFVSINLVDYISSHFVHGWPCFVLLNLTEFQGKCSDALRKTFHWEIEISVLGNTSGMENAQNELQ